MVWCHGVGTHLVYVCSGQSRNLLHIRNMVLISNLPTHPPTHLPTYLRACPSTYQHTHLFTYLPNHLSKHLSIQ